MATRTTTSRTATPQRARPRQSPSTPLRERRADIPVLAAHFLKYYAAANESDVTRFSDDALQLLVNHDWPGNVRQLQNAVEHGVVFAHADSIEVAHRQYGAAPTGS